MVIDKKSIVIAKFSSSNVTAGRPLFFVAALIQAFLLLILFLNFQLSAINNTGCCQNLDNVFKLLRSQCDELTLALKRRTEMAELQTVDQQRCDSIENTGNSDETGIPKFAANFTKLLEHDPETGLLTLNGQEQYRRLVKAINSGLQSDYNNIQLASQSTRLLTSPQGSATFSLVASDSSLFRLPPFPSLQSKEAAAQLIEVYLQAISRDVSFSDYGTGLRTDQATYGSITNMAAAILNRLGAAFLGPRNANGLVDASVLFRGKFKGAFTGPYISQFALLPVDRLFPASLGGNNIDPLAKRLFDQVWAIGSQREFGVSFEDFVAIQNGAIPKKYIDKDFSPDKRYLINGRDTANFWHNDLPFESFYNALCILLANGFPFSKTLPYYNGTMKNESGFVNMNIIDSFSMLGYAAYEAAKTVWAQKWRAHRTLRPEAFAGLVHRAVVTEVNEFGLDNELFDPELLSLIIEKNNRQALIPFSGYTENQVATYLMSQVFPEGSPTHPSYASGHAIFAGACITILKAFFVDNEKIKDHITPVQVDPNDPTKLIPLIGQNIGELTVAGELDKLASNDAFARNFAGIHYRADADFGIQLGELVGISVLQSLGSTYTEQEFAGFELTRLDGQRIRVTPKAIEVVS